MILKYLITLLACCGVLGVLVTFFFIRNDLDRDLAIEDAQFEAYLSANGWSGDIGSEDASLIKAVQQDSAKTVQQDSAKEGEVEGEDEK